MCLVQAWNAFGGIHPRRIGVVWVAMGRDLRIMRRLLRMAAACRMRSGVVTPFDKPQD
jgi:hypothetical protein